MAKWYKNEFFKRTKCFQSKKCKTQNEKYLKGLKAFAIKTSFVWDDNEWYCVGCCIDKRMGMGDY